MHAIDITFFAGVSATKVAGTVNAENILVCVRITWRFRYLCFRLQGQYPPYLIQPLLSISQKITPVVGFHHYSFLYRRF